MYRPVRAHREVESCHGVIESKVEQVLGLKSPVVGSLGLHKDLAFLVTVLNYPFFLSFCLFFFFFLTEKKNSGV